MATHGVADKVVVITGASSGFGRGAARELARRGANVVLAARRGDLLEEVARECTASGARTVAVPTDVSEQAEVERLAQRAVVEFGRIDAWINNAGVGALGRFERVPLADHEQVIATDLLGTLYGSYVAYRHFHTQHSGVLINVASELGRHTVPYYASYAAAKHGVVGLSEALRQEIDQNGIEHVHVCLVMPTAHDTPFFDHAANYTGHEVQAPTPLHDPENVVTIRGASRLVMSTIETES
jgi:short-subunit dehydrogenase